VKTRQDGELIIVNDGQPVARVVIADADPAPPVRFAAEELLRYIRLMSGAELELAAGKAHGPAIVLSTKAADQEDTFSLRMEGDRLYLTGASSRAVLYAVYALLEKLGCGFCVPGEDTVPESRTITVPSLDETHVPAFTRRSQLDHPFQADFPVEGNLAILDWVAKNRFNWYHPALNAWGEPAIWYERRELMRVEVEKRGLHLEIGGHTIHTWLPHARYFAQHPDWYAWIEGSGALLPAQHHAVRQAPAACLSHPDVQRTVARNIIRFLDRCPEVEAVDVWDADVQGYCHCPRCLRGVQVPRVDGWRLSGSGIGGYAQTFDEEILRTAYAVTYAEFLNAVTREVKRKHPRVQLEGLIYTPNGVPAPYWCPNLEDNVVIAVAHILRDSYVPLVGPQRSEVNLRWLAMDIAWRQKSEHACIYEYYHAWTKTGFCPQVNVIADDLLMLHRLGFREVESDQGGWSPLNIYAAARLLWQPELPWEAIVRDFCHRYYGEAAEAMTAYWLELEYGMRGLSGNIAKGESFDWQQAHRQRFLRRLRAILRKASSPETRRRLEREIVPWAQFGALKNIRYALPEICHFTGNR